MGKLPPLSAVRVFEAAARHLSFTKAAVELGMTQAAVSYQIKQLEDRVESPLFRRLPRRLVLTDAGQRLAPQVSDALGRLAQAFAAIRGTDDRRLSLTSLYSFAANWLVPRLGKFQRAHPELTVWMDTSPRVDEYLVCPTPMTAQARLTAPPRAGTPGSAEDRGRTWRGPAPGPPTRP